MVAPSLRFATSDALPEAPPGARVRRVTFRTCPGSDLCLFVACDVAPALDRHGVPQDAWWVVRCANLPDRTLRLYRGAHALRQLLRRYGFLDASGCVHHRDATVEYGPATEPLPPCALAVPAHLRDAIGVPQFYPTSGVCWFAALCTVSFANPTVRDFLEAHMPADLRPLAARCLFSRDAAEALRKRLWYDFAVGDNVDLPPEMDGRNGFSEFTVLCAKLAVPLLRYRQDGGRLVPLGAEVSDRNGRRVRVRAPKTPHEPHLLVLRYEDGDHHRKHPILRRVVHGGARYRLLGLYKGQRKCGHQIGACSPSGSWRDFVIGDADLHKDGIGPLHVRFEGPQWRDRWWDAWRELVHVTKYGAQHREFCNFSWHNEPDDLLDKYRGPPATGQLSIDAVYFTAAP